jgi:hypothetical protein
MEAAWNANFILMMAGFAHHDGIPLGHSSPEPLSFFRFRLIFGIKGFQVPDEPDPRP